MTIDQTEKDKLRALGYSASQASFLWLVALHSGVFLRRQYLKFAGISSGKHATEFLKKLVESRHCRTFPLAGRIAVYHLDSKVIYRAIGHSDLRFRRPHGLDYIKTKLLSLDFILQNPGNTYLATEQEKVDYFVNQPDIPQSSLPAKAYRSQKGKTETIRYFVDKFPLFLSPAAVVHFTFVSAGRCARLEEFRTHLRLYRGLFQRLKEVRMVFIHQYSFHIPAAETCFCAALKAPVDSHFESAGLLRYFELKQAWDRKEYEKVGSEELVFLSQARKRYAGSRYESAYQEWKEGLRIGNRTVERLDANEVRSEFLPYQIDVDPRTFMVTDTALTGDEPPKSCFHPSRHLLRARTTNSEHNTWYETTQSVETAVGPGNGRWRPPSGRP